MRRSLPIRIVVVAVFLAALLWQLLGAVSDLLLWLGIARTTGGSLSATALILLGVGLLVPVAAAVAGLVAARRRTPLPAALILVAALCAARALGVTQLAFFLQVIGAL